MRVRGAILDDESRCAHYSSELDIVAIRFFCCQKLFACHRCHEEYADHVAQPWPAHLLDSVAIRCGACKSDLRIDDYLAVTACPSCSAAFNPGCALHSHLYFETAPIARSA